MDLFWSVEHGFEIRSRIIKSTKPNEAYRSHQSGLPVLVALRCRRVNIVEFLEINDQHALQVQSLWPVLRDRPIISQRALGSECLVMLTDKYLQMHTRFVNEPSDDRSTVELFDIF